jgi:hypothetical protein
MSEYFQAPYGYSQGPSQPYGYQYTIQPSNYCPPADSSMMAYTTLQPAMTAFQAQADYSMMYTTMQPATPAQEAPAAPARPPINEEDYAFPDPTPVHDPDDRPVSILSLPKDGEESAAQANRWKRAKKQPPPPPAPKPINLIACSKCTAQKEDSTIKCHQGHLLCLECAANAYLHGEVECESCKTSWTMLQILHAHYVICGESMQEYHLQRPKDIRPPKDSFICIGKNEHIREKLEEGKEIPFPENGHLTYNRNRAMEACPNNHFLCKPCALRIVTGAEKRCPTCQSVLNYKDDQPEACHEEVK